MASYLGGFARGVAGSLAGRRKRGRPLTKLPAGSGVGGGISSPKVGRPTCGAIGGVGSKMTSLYKFKGMRRGKGRKS
mgnify:CR=1 FL=1